MLSSRRSHRGLCVPIGGALTATLGALTATSIKAPGANPPGFVQATVGGQTIFLPASIGYIVGSSGNIADVAADGSLKAAVQTGIGATLTATIALNGSLSSAVTVGGLGISRILMDTSGWTAASLTFQISADGVTYYSLYDASGAEYTVAALQGIAIVLPAADFNGFQFLKIRSGTSGSPVTQAAQRVLTLVTRTYA